MVCQRKNEFHDSDMGARIASVFVILVVSGLGAFFPLLALKNRFFTIPQWVLFIVRYFGSGVIVATAYVHLLGEAEEALSNECLGGGWKEYSWPSGIALMGTFTMFSIEFFVRQYLRQRTRPIPILEIDEKGLVSERTEEANSVTRKLVNILLLEFGIVFHLVFVGISLAISEDGFKLLFVAIAFHQFFEGMGVGARFATAPWPENRLYIPWLLAALFTLTTPVGIAVGLGVRKTYSSESLGALIVVGISSSFCAGLLIYNGLVELMAGDFLGEDFDDALPRSAWMAYFLLVAGAFVMALIGKWA